MSSATTHARTTSDATTWSPRLWGALFVLCGALFLDGLDVSMIGVALPSIGTALHLSTSALQWVADTAPEMRRNAGISIGLAELSIPVGPASVRLGDQVFDPIQTGWHSKPIFAGENGLLGNGLLSRFSRVTIDAKAGKLILETAKPAN